MRRRALILVAIGLLPLQVEGRRMTNKKKNRKRKKKQAAVLVDYTPSEWTPYVQQAAAIFDLSYRKGTGRCLDRPSAITVCTIPLEEMVNPGAVGELRAGRAIKLGSTVAPNVKLVCHELYHVFHGASHGAWTENPCGF